MCAVRPKVKTVKIADADRTLLPDAVADRLSLQYHLALSILRSGQGGELEVRLLVTIHLHVIGLTKEGIANYRAEVAQRIEAVLRTLINSCKNGLTPTLTDSDYSALCELVTLHDIQLAQAPLRAVQAVHQSVQDARKQNPTPIRMAYDQVS